MILEYFTPITRFGIESLCYSILPSATNYFSLGRGLGIFFGYG